MLLANDEFLADMSQRWREIAMRMALSLHAFSEPGIQTIVPAITIWAINYTRHYGRSFARKLLSMAQPTESYGRRRKAYLEAFRGRPEGTGALPTRPYMPLEERKRLFGTKWLLVRP